MDWPIKMMGLRSFILGALITTHAHAASDSFSKSLIHSKTPWELRATIEKHKLLDILRLSCRLEIKGALLPLSCFELYKQKSRQIDAAKRDHLLIQLNQLCARAVKSDHFPKKLNPSAELSAECRARLGVAARIRDYRELDPSRSPADRDLMH